MTVDPAPYKAASVYTPTASFLLSNLVVARVKRSSKDTNTIVEFSVSDCDCYASKLCQFVRSSVPNSFVRSH